MRVPREKKKRLEDSIISNAACSREGKKWETARRMECVAGGRIGYLRSGQKEMEKWATKRRQQRDAFERGDDRYNVKSIRRSAAM